MKKIIILLAIAAMYYNWNDMAGTDNNSVATHSDVILYETSWCGYCKKARALLDKKGIAYQRKDIEKSTEAYDAYKAIGGKGVPVLDIYGTVIHGYNETAILNALD